MLAEPVDDEDAAFGVLGRRGPVDVGESRAVVFFVLDFGDCSGTAVGVWMRHLVAFVGVVYVWR